MSQLLRGLPEGLVFVLSAPAGTGKTTLVRMLQKEFSCVITESISYTTRKIRPQEIAGRDYHFVSVDEFKKMIAQDDFIEHAIVFGSYYGTSRKFLESQRKSGKHVFLVIDTQGALQLQEKLDAIFIFLSPPSMDILKERLYARKTEDEHVIQERLLAAKREMKQIPFYDYHIVNDQLDTAYQILRSIVIAEEHRVRS